MTKRTYRMLLWMASLTGVLLFIFGNSLMPAWESSEESGALFAFLFDYFPFLTHGLVRKLAHFCEYALLGAHMAAFPSLSMRSPLVTYPVSVLFGTVIACLDEGLQCFVPGRAGLLTDVLIDTAGAVLGFLFFTLILFLIAQKGEKHRA